MSVTLGKLFNLCLLYQFYFSYPLIFIIYLQLMSSQFKKTYTIYQIRPPFDNKSSIKTYTSNKITTLDLEHHVKDRAIFVEGRQVTPKLSIHRNPITSARMSDQLLNKQVSLPSLLSKFKQSTQTIESIDNRSNFYSTKKSSFNTYHKIQKYISDKYNKNIEKLRQEVLVEKKPLTFINLQTTQEECRQRFASERPINVRITKESIMRKNSHVNLTEKHHLNRLKDTYYIPLQLQTQRCEEKEYNIQNLNLQLKNKVRFKFDSLKDLYNLKLQKMSKQDYGDIRGWDYQHNIESRRIFK